MVMLLWYTETVAPGSSGVMAMSAGLSVSASNVLLNQTESALPGRHPRYEQLVSSSRSGGYVRASTTDEWTLVLGPSADGTWGPTSILIAESGSRGAAERNATHVSSSA